MHEPSTVPASSAADLAYAAGCAWVEGEYLPIADARIPITDTGFTRSDCTYDVVAVWHGRFFRLDAHLARFECSWQALRLSPPLDREAMADVLHECVRRSGLHEAYVEMIVTRGSPPPGVRDPRRFANRFYAFAIPYVWIATREVQARGLHLAIAPGMDTLLFEGYRRGFGLPDPDRQVTVAVGLPKQEHRLALRLLDAYPNHTNFTHQCLPSA